MVDLTDDPLTRMCLEARRRVRKMFTDYRERYVDNWEPREEGHDDDREDSRGDATAGR